MGQSGCYEGQDSEQQSRSRLTTPFSQLSRAMSSCHCITFHYAYVHSLGPLSSFVLSSGGDVVVSNPARVKGRQGRSCQGLRGAARQRGRPSCRPYSSRGRPSNERKLPSRRPMPTSPLLSKHSNGWAVGFRGQHDPNSACGSLLVERSACCSAFSRVGSAACRRLQSAC